MIHMQVIKKLKHNWINLPCTPSEWTTQPEYQKITEITLTSGGGMGGKTWKEYVEKTILKPHTLQKVTRIDGKQITINTDYVTYAEDFVLVTAEYYTENTYRGEGYHEVNFLVEEGVEVGLMDKYGDN